MITDVEYSGARPYVTKDGPQIAGDMADWFDRYLRQRSGTAAKGLAR